MDIRVLRYFLAVVKEGTINAAAAALHVSQPTLSRQLMNLEDELGTRLFERGNHAITLTESGIHLKKRAEEMVELMNRTTDEFLHAKAPIIAGEVRIGAGETIAVRRLACAFRTLRQRHPQISINMFSGDYETVHAQLELGLIDFALFVNPVDTRQWEQLVLPDKDRWGLLMRRDHPLAAAGVVRQGDMRRLPLLVSRQTLSAGHAFLAEWLGCGADVLQIVGQYNLIYNASLLAEAGVGSALCMDGLINISPDSSLVFVPLVPELTSSLSLVWKKARPLSRAATLFLQYLVRELSEAEQTDDSRPRAR